MITGGGSGIGKATAEKFLKEGNIVYILGRTEKKLKAACEELSEVSSDIHYIVADISSVKDCSDAVQHVIEKEGRLDILVNSAGVSYSGRTVDMTEEIWDNTIDINLKGTFFMCKSAIPYLIESEGSIVNVSSDAGIVGNNGLAVYCASKGGVSLLTKSLALELAPQKVRVNAVCPAEVDTPMLQLDMEQAGYDSREEFDKEYLKIFPQGENARYVRAGEVAECIYFIASKDKVEAMTGACISLDFGVTCGY